MASPILGTDFLRKFKVIVSPELSQIQFACSAAAPSAHMLSSAAPPAAYCLSSLTPVPAPVPIQPPTATTSSQPPAISAYLVWNPEVKSTSFSFRENKSPLDPPPVFPDVKILLPKFPSILRTGAVKLAPNHGVEHHIHTVSHPPILAKSQIANRQIGIQKIRIRWHCLQIKITMGFSFAHGTKKRRIMAALW